MKNLIQQLIDLLENEFPTRLIVARNNGAIITNEVKNYRVRITADNKFAVRDMDSKTLYRHLTWDNVLTLIK